MTGAIEVCPFESGRGRPALCEAALLPSLRLCVLCGVLRTVPSASFLSHVPAGSLKATAVVSHKGVLAELA